jgi:hypothetical protein
LQKLIKKNMDIKNIQAALVQNGYTVSLLKNNYLVAGVRSKDDSPDGIYTLVQPFTVTLTGNVITLDYGQYQVQQEKAFASVDDLIKFLLQQLPPGK